MPGPSKLELWEPSTAQVALRDAVARAFGFEPSALVGQSRRKPVVLARHAAVWVMRNRWPSMSYPQIGKMLGGRDHSTMINALQLTIKRRQSDQKLRALTDALLARREAPLEPLPEELTKPFIRSPISKVPTELARYRQFMAEVMAEPEPRITCLKLGLRGEAGCPGLSIDEIAHRRDAAVAARRAYEEAQLIAEQNRYGLKRRGLTLSEMAL